LLDRPPESPYVSDEEMKVAKTYPELKKEADLMIKNMR
jgi:hypothetical protein